MEYPSVSEHFLIVEFVPPEIWNLFGGRSTWFIDKRIIDACEKIRVYFDKPVMVNSWHLNSGGYMRSGFRVPADKLGATYSQHKFGRAADIKIKDVGQEEARDVIRKNWSFFGITCIEKDTPTWTHVDIRQTNLNTLLEVPYQ